MAFSVNIIGQDAAQAWSVAEPQSIIMPAPGILIPSSPSYSLPTLKAISIDPNDPLKISFVVDSADQSLNERSGQEQVNLLIKYFLSFLTIPEEELWVNLSPYEKNRIVNPDFEVTNAGRDMLVQDYILKQLASSLTYPDHLLGKVFWKKVYKRVQDEYGTNDIPVTSFNKVWVVPDSAIVYEQNGSAFIAQSRLKVLTEEDYLSINKNAHSQNIPSSKVAKIDHISSEITREIILPELEREINEGKYFAPLRQMYSSLILAIWFKKRYREGIIGQGYVNKKKTAGISLNQKQIKEEIYANYIKALKKGAYNYIKEEADPISNEIIPRKYFSGGFSFAMIANKETILPISNLGSLREGISRIFLGSKKLFSFTIALSLITFAGAHTAHADTGNDTVTIRNPAWNNAHAQGTKEIYIEQPKEFNEIQNNLGAILRALYAHESSLGFRTGWLGAVTAEDEQGNINGFRRGVERMNELAGTLEGITPKQKKIVDTLNEIYELLSSDSIKDADSIHYIQGSAVGPGQGGSSGSYQHDQKKVDDFSNKLGLLYNRLNALLSGIEPGQGDEENNGLIGAIKDTVNVNLGRIGLTEETPATTPVGKLANVILTPVRVVVSPVRAGVVAGVKEIGHEIIPSPAAPTVVVPAITTPENVPAPIAEVVPVLTPTTVVTPEPIPTIVRDSTSAPNIPTPQKAIIPVPTPPDLEQIFHLNSPAVTPIAKTVSTIVQTSTPNFEPAPSSIFSFNIAPTFNQGDPVAAISGVVTNFNAQTEYKKGDRILYLSDTESERQIKDLITKGEVLRTDLRIKQDLLNKQRATEDEVNEIEKKILENDQELAKAKEQDTIRWVTAPSNLTVLDSKVNNGYQVVKGQILLEGYDTNTAHFNITLPTWANDFSRIQVKIDGKPVIVEKVTWSLGPLAKNAEAGLDVISDSPISSNGEVHLELTVLQPNSKFKSLDLIQGAATTLASVGNINTYEVRDPQDGQVIPSVHEGQYVTAGTLLASVEPEHYKEELASIIAGINTIDTQISHARDLQSGILLIDHEQLKSLIIERAGLFSKLQETELELARLEIRSPVNGIVRTLERKNEFGQGDGIFTIGIGSALFGTKVGQNAEIGTSVLFPKEFKIIQGYPVVIETSQGRFPGRVTAINPNPFNPKLNLSGYQDLKILAYDQHGVLQSNLPVKIILPKNDQEKQLILDALTQAEKAVGTTSSAGSPPPPPEKTNYQDLLTQRAGTLSITTQGPSLFTTQTNPQQHYLTLGQVNSKVSANPLNTYVEATAYDELKLSENAAYDTRFSFFGGPVIKDGKIEWNGGITGQVTNSFQAGLQSGNAISAGLPLISSFIFNLRDILDGKAQQERKLAQNLTQEARFHKQAALNSVLGVSQHLLIDIGAAQEKISQLNDLLSYLKNSKQVVEQRQEQGLSLIAEVASFDNKITDIESQISALKYQIEEWTITLNFFKGEPNENLSNSIFASLPWDEQVKPISPETVKKWAELLTSENSPDPQMREAFAAYSEAVKSSQLQGLENLPSLGVTDVGVKSTNPVTSSPVGLSPNESAVRTSELTQGQNVHPSVGVDILNTDKKRREEILSLKVKESLEAKERKTAEITKNLQEKVDLISSLYERLQLTTEAYQKAVDIISLKERNPFYYLSSSLFTDRLAANLLIDEIIDLKAQILKAKADLELLGIKVDASTQDKPNREVVSFAKIGSEISTNPEQEQASTLPLASPQQNVTLNASEQQIQASNSVSGAGTVDFQVNNNDMPSAWALMNNGPLGSNGNPLSGIKQILKEDQDIFVRADTLHHLLNEFQNNNDFITTLNDIIQHSPHTDVVWEILKFMGSQEDHGLHFIVQAIDDGAANHNQLVVNLGFQALGDILTAHPEILEQLSPEDFTADSQYPQTLPENAEKVLLAFLNQEPNSFASQNLLKSDYWNTSDLARIYNSLHVYIDTHQGEQGIDNVITLSQMIYDSILRKEALNNIDEIFRPGYFGNPGSIVLNEDILTTGRIKEISQQNRDFLNFSPNRIQEFIHPKLFASAEQAAKNLISINQPGSQTIFLNNFLHDPSDHNVLEYFTSLGLDGQTAYIANLAKSNNISELARILNLKPDNLQSPLLTVVLDDLMADTQGRLLVFKTYVDSSDQELLKLIEARPWLNTIREDIKAVKNPAGIDTIRNALAKRYSRTQEEWAWNIIDSQTYSDLELHSLNDPRGDTYKDAQIKVAATKTAIEALEEMQHYKLVLWAGYRLQSPQEIDELTRLKQEIDQQIDPLKIVSDIDHRVNSVTDDRTKKMLELIISMRDQIAKNISNNDQTIPKFPLLWLRVGIALLSAGGLLLLRNFFKKSKIAAQNRDIVNNILYIADRVTSLEHMDQLNGEETYEPNRQMIKTRDDGIKIINMPRPIHVEPKAQKSMEGWWGQLIKWNKKKPVSSEVAVNEFHEMTKLALDTLRAIPYNPKLMQSPSGQYQKTLFYYITLANYTLYLLTKNMENKDLNDQQRKQLRDDLNALIQSIKYASDFSLFLHYRANIQRVLTRTLPDNHPLEQKKWWLLGFSPYGIARSYLLFTLLLSKSLKKGNKSLDNLLNDGNNLLGLYSDKEVIKKESQKYLKDVISRGGMDQVIRAHDTEIRDKIGNFWREIKYPIQAGIILSSLIGSIFVFPGFASFAAEISTFALIFHFWSVWFYAKPNVDFLDTTWSKEINDLAYKQQAALNKSIDAAQLSTSDTQTNQRGGIDFSKAADSVLFKQTGSSSNSSVFSSDSLKSFKGFDFQVIQYQPISDPVELFLGFSKGFGDTNLSNKEMS